MSLIFDKFKELVIKDPIQTMLFWSNDRLLCFGQFIRVLHQSDNQSNKLYSQNDWRNATLQGRMLK